MTTTAVDSPRIFAVVLAAGQASRFGSTKQLAPLPGTGETLLRRALRLALKTCGDRTLLVAGHDAGAVVAGAGDDCRFVTVNARHAEGLGTSVARATHSLAHVADAMLLMLVDQPRISACPPSRCEAKSLASE